VNEIKHDGFRVIAWKNGKRIKLYSLGQGPRLPLSAETTEQPANAPPWLSFGAVAKTQLADQQRDATHRLTKTRLWPGASSIAIAQGSRLA
jgi:hypothetical protein